LGFWGHAAIKGVGGKVILSSFSQSSNGRLQEAANFDFTRAAADPRISFARAGATATRINSNGFIEAVAADTPRFDFDPVTLACRGLLVEGAATNSVFDSAFQTFSGSAVNNVWLNLLTNLTTTANLAVSPDQGTNAALLQITSATSFRSSSYRTNIAAAGDYTFSVFVKKASTDDLVTLQLSEDVSGTSRVQSSFSLTGIGNFSGSLFASGTLTNATRSISQYRDGWYLCSVSCTLTAPTNISAFIFPGNRTTQTVASQNFVWGAQVESGLQPTSLIPTASGAVTRNADVATITGADFSDWWQAGKGSALVRARPSTIIGIRPALQFDDATADNIIALRGNGADPELYVRTGGVDQAQIDAGTIAANTSYRLAGAWAENSCAASLNSGTPVLDGVATIPTVTQARLGSDGTNYLNGHIEAIEYYDERIPNSALQVVSSAAGYQSIIGSVFRDAIIS
jgi:hypothetical protein